MKGKVIPLNTTRCHLCKNKVGVLMLKAGQLHTDKQVNEELGKLRNNF